MNFKAEINKNGVNKTWNVMTLSRTCNTDNISTPLTTPTSSEKNRTRPITGPIIEWGNALAGESAVALGKTVTL